MPSCMPLSFDSLLLLLFSWSCWSVLQAPWTTFISQWSDFWWCHSDPSYSRRRGSLSTSSQADAVVSKAQALEIVTAQTRICSVHLTPEQPFQFIVKASYSSCLQRHCHVIKSVLGYDNISPNMIATWVPVIYGQQCHKLVSWFTNTW